MIKKDKRTLLFTVLILAGLLVSAIKPHDYFTWILEVFPAIIGLLVIILTYKKFPLSNLLYILILIHSYVLFIGGHYTYAKVPLFEWIKDALGQERNNYDKIGHLMQGFVPAIIARELLIRKNVVQKRGWLFIICVSMCLAISAVYELIEALVAMLTGESAEAFLGTQGYVWDTQSDMFFAFSGALVALSLLPKLHDESIRTINTPR